MCIGLSFRSRGESIEETAVPSPEFSETKVTDRSLESRPFLLKTERMFLNDCLIGDFPLPFFSRLSGVARVNDLVHELVFSPAEAAEVKSVSYFPISSLVVPLRAKGGRRETGMEKYGPYGSRLASELANCL
jgi:hypothetical protein